jgi:hypothetical protein
VNLSTAAVVISTFAWQFMLLLATVTSFAGRAEAQNLIVDGGFETPGGSMNYTNGQTYGPWTVVGDPGGVDILSGSPGYGGITFQPYKGNSFADLTGADDTGSSTGLAQTVNTTVGATYKLTLWLGNAFYPPPLSEHGTFAKATVYVGQTPILTAFNDAGQGTNQIYWQRFSVDFVATSAQTTLSFINSSPAGFAINGLDNVSLVPARVVITNPPKPAQFSLSNGDYTQTDMVNYEALSGDLTDSINWTVTLQYETSGHKGKTSFTQNFTTQPNITQSEQYTSMGGFASITATQAGLSDYDSFIITGVQLPASEITAAATSLYTANGTIARATPNLMTGIAEVESTYQQFYSRLLFNWGTALWPNESRADGGSHMGLMMDCIVSRKDCGNAASTWQAIEWNWQTNLTNGTALFTGYDLGAASRNEARMRRSVDGLGPLTPSQLEDMAVGNYGQFSSGEITRQVYIPSCMGGTVDGKKCDGGKWVWIYNTANNPDEVAYVMKVRSNLQ